MKMLKALGLIVAAALLPLFGIVAYNVSMPPNDAQRLIEFALPPIALTGEGVVLPAWRKPIQVVVITDEAGGTQFSHVLIGFLRTLPASPSLAITETDLATSGVGRGEGKLAICVCKDIYAVAQNQLSESLAYQIPNDTERAAMLNGYEKKGSKGFLALRMPTKTREVDSATVYVSADIPVGQIKEAAGYVLLAISPQLQYKQRASTLTEVDLGMLELTEFGKLYLSVMLSEGVTPGMSRAAFEAIVPKNP